MLRKVLILILVVAFLGTSCGGGDNTTIDPNTDPLTLTIWRVFDGPDTFTDVVERYQEIHPNVDLQVETKNYATYELEVANAIAAGAGPDILMIRNDWLPKHIDKLQAMPEELLTEGESNLDVLKDRYPDVVTAEATREDQVYGIPLSIDSLALYYNEDHFREAGLTKAPSTWNEFIDAVQKLTKLDSTDRSKVLRAGAAIGTAGNVNRSVDILQLLMLQNHTPMVNEDRSSSLMNGALEKSGGGRTYPGTTALEFYTGFADPKKSVYTWNNAMPNSIDAFAAGDVSMIFSYAYLERTLLQKNPTLTYGIAPMPQVDNTPTPADYPTYWLEVVSRTTTNSEAAWEFLRFMSDEGDALYQAASGKPPAKRQSVIPKSTERILNNAPGSPWTFQASTAATWYKGTNPGRIEQVFVEMIDNVISFGQTPQVAIDNAASQVTKSLQGGR